MSEANLGHIKELVNGFMQVDRNNFFQKLEKIIEILQKEPQALAIASEAKLGLKFHIECQVAGFDEHFALTFSEKDTHLQIGKNHMVRKISTFHERMPEEDINFLINAVINRSKNRMRIICNLN